MSKEILHGFGILLVIGMLAGLFIMQEGEFHQITGAVTYDIFTYGGVSSCIAENEGEKGSFGGECGDSSGGFLERDKVCRAHFS